MRNYTDSTLSTLSSRVCAAIDLALDEQRLVGVVVLIARSI
jgi:hypothetical protein